MPTRLDKYNNDWYHPGANPIKCVLWYYCNILFLKSYWLPISRWKVFLLRLFGAKIGKGVVIKPGVNIKYPWRLYVGNHVWIGEQVWIDNLDQVTIEDHVCISQGAYLLTGNHNYKKTTFDLITQPILLKEGTWVGAFAIVSPGVTLESHAVLSVKSVATKDLEAYSIYQGNPAKKIRQRSIG